MDSDIPAAMYGVAAAYVAGVLYAIAGGWKPHQVQIRSNTNTTSILALPTFAFIVLCYAGLTAWTIIYSHGMTWSEDDVFLAAISTAPVFACSAQFAILRHLELGRGGWKYRWSIIFGCAGIIITFACLDPRLFFSSDHVYIHFAPVAATALYSLLAIIILLFGWESATQPHQTRLLILLTLPIAVFIASWFSGSIIWSRFWEYRAMISQLDFPVVLFAKWTSAVFALLLSTALFARLATGHASRQYLQLTLFTSILLLALIATITMFIRQ